MEHTHTALQITVQQQPNTEQEMNRSFSAPAAKYSAAWVLKDSGTDAARQDSAAPCHTGQSAGSTAAAARDIMKCWPWGSPA